MAHTESSEAEKSRTLRKIINDANTAFMVTHSTAGGMHGRPMATVKLDETFQTLWFPTDRNSGKVRELAANPYVCLGYTNSTGSEWASVYGRAHLVDDRAKIRELWSPVWKMWFESPDDPKLALIAVVPESAEYWDSGSQVLQMLKFAVSAVTGKHLSEGKNAHLNLGTSHTA